MSVNNNNNNNILIYSANNFDDSPLGPGYDPKVRPNPSSSTASNTSNNKITSQESDVQSTTSQQLQPKSAKIPRKAHSSTSHQQSDQSPRPQMVQNYSYQLPILSPHRLPMDFTANPHQNLDQSHRPQMVQPTSNNNNNNNNNTSNSRSQSPRPQMAKSFTNIQEILQMGATACQSFFEIEAFTKRYFEFLLENFDWEEISERAIECTNQFYSIELEESLTNATAIIDSTNISTITFEKENFRPFIKNLEWFDQDQLFNLDKLLNLPSVDLVNCDLKTVYANFMAGDKFSVVSNDLRKDICNLVRPYYDKLDNFDKKIIEKLIIGFDENINYSLIDSNGNKNFIEKPNKKDNKKILQYLNSESESKRVRKVEFSDIPRFKNDTFYSCRIIPVDEIKFKNGIPFHRDRFVINAVKSNELVLPPFNLQNSILPQKFFTTPSPEIIFTHDKLFFDLLSSKKVTIYDRQSFYRQWKTAPSFWPASVQTSFNEKGDLDYWVDVCGRMGNKYSAHVAQGIVSVIDKIFGYAQKDSVCITNQDDSLILKSTEQSALLYRQINEKMGFTFNESKTQFNVSTNATWCGYTFNLVTKTIKIKQKRISKFEAKLHEILTNKFVSRRDFARIIGMIWSSRLLFFGRRVLINPALYFVRKTSKIFKNYVNEVDLKEKEWDHKVETNDLLKNELLSCAEIMKSEIPLWNVRNGFKNYLRIQQKVLSTKIHHIQIHSDASLSKAGVGLLLNGKAFSFRYNFNRQYLDQSINFKEFFAVLLGYFLAIIFRYLFLPNLDQVNLLFLIDNTCAENIAISRKAAAKNAELSVLSKCLCDLERSFGDCVADFVRIKTEENRWADAISRSNCNQLDIEKISILLDAFSFMLGSKVSDQSKIIKKLIPKWLGPPPNLPKSTLPNPLLTPNQSSL